MNKSDVNIACYYQELELRTSCESEMDINEVNPACHHQESQLRTICESEMDMNACLPSRIRITHLL